MTSRAVSTSSSFVQTTKGNITRIIIAFTFKQGLQRHAVLVT